MTRTRGQRREAGSPLVPFDLDPFQSNTDRFLPDIEESGGTASSGILVNPEDLGSLFEGSLPSMSFSRPVSAVSNDPGFNGQQREVSAEPYWSNQSSRAPTHRSPTISSDYQLAEPYFLNEPRPGTDDGGPLSPVLSGFAASQLPGQFPNWYQNVPVRAPGPPTFVPQPAPNLYQPVPRHYPMQNLFPHQFPPGFLPNMGYPQFQYPMFPYHAAGLSVKMRPEDQQIDKLNEKDRLKNDGSNFFTWVTLVKSSLKTKGWLDYAEGRVERPNLATEPVHHQTWERIDDLTKHQIGMNMDASMYHQLGRNASTAFDLWSSVRRIDEESYSRASETPR